MGLHTRSPAIHGTKQNDPAEYELAYCVTKRQSSRINRRIGVPSCRKRELPASKCYQILVRQRRASFRAGAPRRSKATSTACMPIPAEIYTKFGGCKRGLP